MADFKTATTVGARIAALRKARGFASAKALADAIPGDSITDSILRNIEAGRKNDLAVAQLLNLAWALHVSPMFILAPLGTPDEDLDLPNIIPELQQLSTAEFDAWASGISGGAYRPINADEMNERTQLEAHRELLQTRREVHRIRVMMQLADESGTPGGVSIPAPPGTWDDLQQRLDDANRNIAQLEAYLSSGGWNIASSGDHGDQDAGTTPHRATQHDIR